MSRIQVKTVGNSKWAEKEEHFDLGAFTEGLWFRQRTAFQATDREGGRFSRANTGGDSLYIHLLSSLCPMLGDQGILTGLS